MDILFGFIVIGLGIGMVIPLIVKPAVALTKCKCKGDE